METIEQRWDRLAEDLKNIVGSEELERTRVAFYAGHSSMFGFFTDFATLPPDESSAYVEAVAEELHRFNQDLRTEAEGDESPQQQAEA